MKRAKRFSVALVLAASALWFASAGQSGAGQSEYSQGGEALLQLKHSPVLGLNIPIAVWIDGMQAGAFTKGHLYERTLTPGRHTLYASRPSRLSDSFYGTLDVRPGETYSFVVKCSPNQVHLVPVSRFD
jgi:hypothetical protein